MLSFPSILSPTLSPTAAVSRRSRLTGAPARVLAQAAVLTAVVGGTVAYADSGATFSLSVDGQVRQVHGDAKTVREVLAAGGVAVTSRDLVAPTLDSPVLDGQQVVVRFARPVAAVVDGQPRTFWTTELTLDAALGAMGIRAADARLSVSRSQPLGRGGLSLSVVTPKIVTISVDGQTRVVTSTAPTVGELLVEQHLTLGALDTMSALTGAPVVDGLALAVTRIEHKTVTQTQSIPFPVTEQKVSTLASGQRRTVTPGQNGAKVSVYDVTLADGQEAGRDLLSSTITDQPVSAVVQIGTRPSVASSPSSRSTSSGDPSAGPTSGSGSASSSGASGGKADGLNWSALAKCESGGNPRAVNPAGYYGLYQFSLSTWRSVGGSGNPIEASPAEQLMRAKLLYNKAGAGQWGCGRHLFD